MSSVGSRSAGMTKPAMNNAGAGFVASSGGNADQTDTTTVSRASGDEAAAALVAAQAPGGR
jgi:hypothetical protein